MPDRYVQNGLIYLQPSRLSSSNFLSGGGPSSFPILIRSNARSFTFV